jgi:hypothetical protein
MSFRHRPLMTSVYHLYEWHCSHAWTLDMGRTLEFPSVIELAPCKYKRIYFGVQKKLITYQISTNDIYLIFFFFLFLSSGLFQILYSSETYISLVLMYQSNFCKLLVCILFITYIYALECFCNINHCNDSAPCWDLDWTMKSYLILSCHSVYFTVVN